MRAALSRHDELLRKTVGERDGVVFSSMGDGIAAAFLSASGAVAAAADAQRLLEAEAWPTVSPVGVRMGVHTGEAEVRDGDYFGTAVKCRPSSRWPSRRWCRRLCAPGGGSRRCWRRDPR